MKKFRRLAALLVAGVMALMMFAGCSGSGVNTAVENELLKQLNTAMRTEFKNDPALHAIAMQQLGKIDQESGLIRSDDAMYYGPSIENGKVEGIAVYVVVREKLDDTEKYCTAVEITPEMQKNLTLKDVLGADANDLEEIGTEGISAITFAARTINGRTYVAFGVRGEMDAS